MMSLLKKVRNKSVRTRIWMEYTRAELLVKGEGERIDSKTGLELNAQQMREKEIEQRMEALSVITRALREARTLEDPEVTYEGCLLVWNLSLPFMNQGLKDKVYKGFNAASEELELVAGTDYDLRVKLHLELGKLELGDGNLHSALENVRNGMELAAFQDRKPCWEDLINLEEKIRLKKNSAMAAGGLVLGTESKKNLLDLVVVELEKTPLIKSESGRYDALSQCFKMVCSYNKEEFFEKEEGLVAEEIQVRRQRFEEEQERQLKKKNLLLGELLELMVEFNLFDLAQSTGRIITNQKWSGKSDLLMGVKKCEAFFLMAQAGIKDLTSKGHSFAFSKDDSAGEFHEYTEEELLKKKRQIVKDFQSGAELAERLGQHWMVFDGAVTLWNCYLPVFKNSLNDGKLLPETKGLLRVFFECMKNSIKDIEKRIVADYDLDSKIQVYGHLTLVYARLLEHDRSFEEVRAVTDALLLAPLSAQTRKMVNSARARVFASLDSGSEGVSRKAKGGHVQPKGKSTNPRRSACV